MKNLRKMLWTIVGINYTAFFLRLTSSILTSIVKSSFLSALFAYAVPMYFVYCVFFIGILCTVLSAALIRAQKKADICLTKGDNILLILNIISIVIPAVVVLSYVL